ncbi:SCF E3 ubiquitin ligase complex F-box protein grrA [Linum perenne]
MLCDELIQEIFTKIPPGNPPSSSASSLSIPLVSKRWLHLYRASKTSISLRITLLNHTNHDSSAASLFQSLSSLLSNYPFLSSLSLLPSDDPSSSTSRSLGFNDRLLFLVSSLCFKLNNLKFLNAPVSSVSLRSLSNSCTLLTSLTVSLSRPLDFNWVASFSSLKDLSVYVYGGEERGGGVIEGQQLYSNRGTVFYSSNEGGTESDAELGLESVSFTGIGRDDCGIGLLWRRCRRLKKLSFKSCEGIGDGGSFCSFVNCLKGLQELELRTCRNIADGVLLRLAENSSSLVSLLLYDGGSRDGLLYFLTNSRCSNHLSKLDFRLPLDLSNDHLSAVAMNFTSLKALRLQSCCLVTGEGLKALGNGIAGLEELALINCGVVERESGLLATLGHKLKQLRKLDLSYNEYLFDKELVGMLASCTNLVELRLRGCRRLTGTAMMSMFRSCSRLESVDIAHCYGIDYDAVEMFFLNSPPQLRRLQVEEEKLSDAARAWASRRCIELLG